MVSALMLALIAQAAAKLPDGYVPPTLFAKVGYWTIEQSLDRDTCTMSASYNGDTDFYGIYYPRRDSLTIFINNPKLKSLKADADYKVKLFFRKNNRLDDGWGDISIHGYTDTSGKPGYNFKLNATDALRDIASSTTLATMYDDKVVDALNLDGSSDMVAAVRRCGAAIVKLHPIDPFEK